MVKRANSKFRPETSKAVGNLPKIQTNARYLRDITTDAVNALQAANEPPKLFMRGSVLARINGENRVELLDQAGLKGLLDRTANFVTVKPGGGVTPARPPYDLAPDIMALPSLPFPKLEGISTVPLFMPDGSLLCTSGYHPGSGLYLHLEGLGDLQTNMPVGEALDLLLNEVFADFPFADVAGKAHALCLVLEPFVQRLVGNVTPLYQIDAPTRGTGKGLLADIVATIVTGKTAPVMVLPANGEELEKRVTSALLEGSTYLLLDNVTRLKSPVLAAAITSGVWRGRRLGKSEMVDTPNTSTWVVTGNNIELSDEIARRILPIRLDTGVERPENRTGFRHPNLKAFVLANRSRLVSACLSLIQAWVNQGMPQGTQKLGSFERWCGVMGGILGVAGVSGFLFGRERLYGDADSDTREWGYLVTAWAEAHGKNRVTAKDVFSIAKQHGLLMDLWAGRSDLGAMQRLGHALNNQRDRVFAGYRIRLAGNDRYTGNISYSLEKLGGNRTTQTPATPSGEGLGAGVAGVSGFFPQPEFLGDEKKDNGDDGNDEGEGDDAVGVDDAGFWELPRWADGDGGTHELLNPKLTVRPVGEGVTVATVPNPTSKHAHSQEEDEDVMRI
jgi:hypothetical protein